SPIQIILLIFASAAFAIISSKLAFNFSSYKWQ
ncbi:uncharacterized protein METZ01_LOCUS254793, partial [marine metagenome]